MSKAQKNTDEDEILGPAKLHSGHVRDRNLSAGAGAKRGYRNAATDWLEWANEGNYFEGGPGDYSADRRYQAARKFKDLREVMRPAGKDSTVERLGGGSEEERISKVIAASQECGQLKAFMSDADYRILVRFCGDDESPASAIRAVCGDRYRRHTKVRLIEALNALVDAFDSASRARVVMYRRV